MLKWIVGSKLDHPLADMKQARALVAELPAHDSINALEEITRWLESLAEADGFRLDRLFEVIDLLDSTARNHHKRLVHEYLGMPRQQKSQENRLWTCGYKFTRALAASYMHCLKLQESGAAGAAAMRKQMPLIVARGLRVLGMQVKWTMLRYGPFEPGLWTSIGELYRHAERGGYAATTLEVYPGAHSSGTAQQEYLKVMMLWASSADVLPPLKQDIAERTVAYAAAAFRMAEQPFAGALYRFDPTRNRPPTRLHGAAAAGGNAQYFGPGDAPAKLAQLLAALAKSGKLPADVDLGANYPADLLQSVLKHLAAYWSDNPPSRLSERRAATARITVVPGYSQLVDELERDETDALNFSVSGAESWVVENVSENGYGALVPATATDWLRVGELLGLQLEGAPEWSLAIVRRVARDEQRKYHVGIEVIARAVKLVRFSDSAKSEPETAVLLGTMQAGGEAAIVMRAGRYHASQSVELAAGGRSYVLEPAQLIDAGDDYEWARYRVAAS